MATADGVFGGVDWGSKVHQACVVSSDGTTQKYGKFDHSGEGLAAMATWFADRALASSEGVAVAIEVPNGPVVDSLMARGIEVYSINPKQLDRFRDRFSPSGAKDDRRDALVLADSLRTDCHSFRKVKPKCRTTLKLQAWSKLFDDLGKESTRLSNQIRQELWRYYPQILGVTDRITNGWFLDLWERVPTPAEGRRLHPNTVRGILQRNRIRRITPKQVCAALREPSITVAPGATEAACVHIRSAVKRLRVVLDDRKNAEKNRDRLLKELEEPAPVEGDEQLEKEDEGPRDATILLSIPGVGPSVAAALLTEAATALEGRNHQALRCLCGVAPVTRRSGKSTIVTRRLASNRRLVRAAHHWAGVAMQKDPVSKAKYAALRARGHSHPRALRSVADRLLGVACAMLRHGTLFEPRQHPRAA